MFVSPHDDDIVAGAGLTFQAAIAEGAEVHAVITTDGRMGYCRPAAAASRSPRSAAQEGENVVRDPRPAARADLRFLEFPDCNLNAYRGRQLSTTRAARRRSTGPAACKTPIPTSCARSGRRASSCRPAPTCIPTTGSSTRRCSSACSTPRARSGPSWASRSPRCPRSTSSRPTAISPSRRRSASPRPPKCSKPSSTASAPMRARSRSMLVEAQRKAGRSSISAS